MDHNNLSATAGRLEAQAIDLERFAVELRQQAAELRAVTPTEPLPALSSINQAVQRFGLSAWGVRKLLDDGVLREVRVGDRRLIQTSSLLGFMKVYARVSSDHTRREMERAWAGI